MLGVTFKGATTFIDNELGAEENHRSFGMAVSRFGAGVIAAEGVVMLTPGFFDGTPPLGLDVVESSHVFSATGNVILTTPRLWTEYSLRPFVSAGVGLLRARSEDLSGAFAVNANMTGLNLAAGAIGFLSDRTGVRFEMRYHRTIGRPDVIDMTLGDEPARLRYFTASIGLVIRTGR